MRDVSIMLASLGLVAASLMPRAPATAATQPDGAAAYKRCAACHLAAGAGVPGAFPPLAGNVKSLAQTADGRRYLALVVIKGVSGPLTVEGKSYRGVMPAQGDLDDATTAALLDHVVAKIAKGKAKPFTAPEIAAARKAAATLKAADIAKLKPMAGQK